MVDTYRIQQWLFDTAHGKYDIDLGASGVQVQYVDDLTMQSDWEVDYSPDRGFPETRRAIADLYGSITGADDVVVTNGAQEALYLFYRVFLEPGNHVVTTFPGWQQSWQIPQEIGCQVSKLHWAPGTDFDTATLAEILRRDTKLLILTSPGNPSGTSISASAWDQIIGLIEPLGIWLVVDEEFLIEPRSSAIQRYERAVSVSGLSKVYGLPGLRVGWSAFAGGPGGPGPGREVAEKIVNYKRYTTVSNCSLAERAATQVMGQHDKHTSRYLSLVDAGLPALTAFATENSGAVRLVPPHRTPFAFFHLRLPISSFELAKELLDTYRVLIMPAELFGSGSGFRLTYARSPNLLAEGLDRLGAALKAAG